MLLPDDTTLVCPACGALDLGAADFPRATLCPSCAPAAWAAAEDTFAGDDYCGLDPAGSLRSIDSGRGVIFTASGAVNYYRGDQRIPAGRFTGSLALTLASLTGQSALVASGQATQLPVRDTPERTFADRLAQTVAPGSMVVELRGMRERSFDICVGTGPLPDDRIERFTEHLVRSGAVRGLTVVVNEPFGALPPWTVPHYAQVRLGVPAVQVQLAHSLRDPVHRVPFAQLTLGLLRAAALA